MILSVKEHDNVQTLLSTVRLFYYAFMTSPPLRWHLIFAMHVCNGGNSLIVTNLGNSNLQYKCISKTGFQVSARRFKKGFQVPSRRFKTGYQVPTRRFKTGYQVPARRFTLCQLKLN